MRQIRLCCNRQVAHGTGCTIHVQGLSRRVGEKKRRRVDLNHRPLGYEPFKLSLIWRNLNPFLGQ